jgi:hypothetical protein
VRRRLSRTDIALVRGCGAPHSARRGGRYIAEQPGWLEQVVAESCEQVVGVPTQAVVPLDHMQPYSAAHVVADVFEPHSVTLPVHEELQEQLYSLEQAVDVVFELHGVIVPLHVAEQPAALEHCVEVNEEQGVSVPVHAVVHEHPALLHRLDAAYDEHAEGVPLQV